MKKRSSFAICILLAFVAVAAFSACKEGKQAIQSQQHGEFTNELLFVQDSCKIYRFVDNGRYIYWSDCRGRIEYTYTQRVGKVTHVRKQQTLNN